MFQILRIPRADFNNMAFFTSLVILSIGLIITQASPITSHDEKTSSLQQQLTKGLETRLAEFINAIGDELSTPRDVLSSNPEDDVPAKSGLSAASSTVSTSAIAKVLRGLPGRLGHANIVSLIDNFKSLSRILKALLRLSPPMRRIVDQTSKKNVEFRFLFKTFSGKFPSLTDLFQLLTKKHNNMWYDFVIASNNDPSIKEMIPLMKEPNPDYQKILNLLFGSDPDKKFDNGKYTVRANDIVQNKNVVELVHFLMDNWLSLNINVFEKLFTYPTDYAGILRSFMKLDYSHFPTSLKSAAVLSNDKYAIIDKAAPGEAETPDRDLVEILYDVHVFGPQILNRQDVNTKAAADVLDILTKFTNALSNLVGATD